MGNLNFYIFVQQSHYNHERIQLNLKGLSPVQFRTQSCC
ncbi:MULTISPECIES: IS3 family transposase [unclassified Acinetobacter]